MRIIPLLAGLSILGLASNSPNAAEPGEPGNSDSSDTHTCLEACVMDPLNLPPGCACAGGSVRSPGPITRRNRPPTARDFIEHMQTTYASEIAFVDDYLVIEKTKIAPLPETRYYEKKGDGSFGQITIHEMGRRNTMANPPSDELPPEVAEDPTLLLGGFADAFDIIGAELGMPVGGSASEKMREAEADAKAAFDEGKEGIAGTDDSDGLLGDDSLEIFLEHGTWDRSVIGLFRPDESGNRFQRHRYNGEYLSPIKFLWDVFTTDVTLTIDADAYYKRLTRGETEIMVEEREVWGIETYGVYICVIMTLGKTDNVASMTLESGEMWACYIPDSDGAGVTLRPVRIRLEYLTSTNAGYHRTVVERVTDKYRKVGPITLAHRIRERIGQGSEDIGQINWQDARSGIDKLRKYKVNEGLPTQQELTEEIAKAQEDPELMGSE